MNTLDRVFQHASPSGLMRLVGVMVVIAGMCSFLLEEWQNWNDLGRYYVMFGGTCLFAGAGLLMSYLFRDQTSARVFLGLALASVVANFTTLGGLVHSLVQWDGNADVLAQLPEFAQWQVADGAGLLVALLAGFAVLLPVAWFAFKVLAGNAGRTLTFTFAVLNSLLLLPVRDSFVVGVLVALAVALPLWVLRTTLRERLTLKTLEGKAALAALAAPALIMVARSVWLYEADAVLTWMLSGIALVVLHYLARAVAVAVRSDQEARTHAAHIPLLAVSLCLIVVHSIAAWMLLEPLLTTLLSTAVVDVLGLPVLALTASGLLVLISRAYPQGDSLVTLAGIVFAAANILNGLDHSGLLAMSVGVGAGLLLMWVGRARQQGVLLASAWATMVLAILPEALNFVGRVDFTNWLTLTIIGVLVIVVAALIDKKGWSKSWLKLSRG